MKVRHQQLPSTRSVYAPNPFEQHQTTNCRITKREDICQRNRSNTDKHDPSRRRRRGHRKLSRQRPTNLRTDRGVVADPKVVLMKRVAVVADPKSITDESTYGAGYPTEQGARVVKRRGAKLSLLQRVLCFSPVKSFVTFDVNKLLRMTEFYPNDFIDVPEVTLPRQLKNYVGFKIFVKLVETNKCNTFAMVYKLLKLALLLLVATASVERVFLAMKVVKYLCNKMGDQ
ncbi:hypothetical protein MTR_3g060650 [Medicago truncatula]|uniref:Uncharacterized protein n=1 Tax=Medicago truncatula TaxID=3880 RepID=G7IXR6_MEDTR|nr:hypothetical protein MTR_3g060650 [Medicago truncatula]